MTEHQAEASTTDGAFKIEIGNFFDRYVEAFSRGDADALSAMWDEVALFPSPTANFAMERPAFRDHLVTLLDFYCRQGVARPEGRLLDATELLPNVALARLAYTMWADDGVIVAEWEHVYVLRKRDHWRVSLTIADGEMEAWTAKGAEL